MREPEIKAAVLAQLRANGDISTRAIVANEYALGRSAVRADLAVLQGKFIGVEIKSHFDSLKRLSRQMLAYQQFFDRTILVVAEKHISAISKIRLEGVEIWALIGSRIVVLREASCVSVDRRSRLELLTMTQRRKWLGVESANGEEAAFFAEFSARFGGTSAAFWRSLGRRKIKKEDLALLSRFHDLRADQRRIALDRAKVWGQWAASDLGAQSVHSSSVS